MLCSTSSGAVCTFSNVAIGTQRCRVADTGTAPSRDQSSLRWKPNGGLEVRDAREGVYSRGTNRGYREIAALDDGKACKPHSANNSLANLYDKCFNVT